MFYGIDVSNTNGPVHWDAVAKQAAPLISFAHVKASEGVSYSDAYFLTNVAQARAAGLHVGPYHFARPDLHASAAGAKAEAQFFASKITGIREAWDMRPVLDLEEGSGNLTVWAGTFLAEVERLTGVRPMLYVSPGFASAHLTLSLLKAYPLWVADYGPNDGREHPTSLAHVEHQFTSVAVVQGVMRHTDENEAASMRPLLVKVVAPAPKRRGVVAPHGEAKNQNPFTRKMWPMPIPAWFWEWAAWRQEGKSKGSRPLRAPLVIPAWAWVRLRAMR